MRSSTLPGLIPAAPSTSPTRPGRAAAQGLPAGAVGLSRRRLGTGALAVAAAAGFAGACGRDRPVRRRGVDRVTFLTTFGSQGRDAYAYVAAELGLFAEAGIEVDIQPGQAGDSNHGFLTAGTAHFAAVDGSGALIRYGLAVSPDASPGAGDTGFQVLAAVHQQTLISIIGMADRIRTPKDLEGRIVGSAPGAVPRKLFPAYAQLTGIDPDRVRWEEVKPDQLAALVIAGKIDAAGLFIVAQPSVHGAAGGRKTTALAYGDVMTDLYGAVIVAQKSLIRANPDLCRRFTTALLQGLTYAVTNPDEAGRILATRVPGQKPELAAAELDLMRPYVISGNQPVGGIDLVRVARSVAVLTSLGLIPAGANPDLPAGIVNMDIVDAAAHP